MNDTTKNQNLDDFGEVIHGAKKHNFADLDLTNADTRKLPFSKLWAKSEIDAIEDVTVAAIAHHIRSSLPSKPRKPLAQKNWFTKLENAQTTVAWLVSRPESAKTLIEKLEAGGWNDRVGAFSIQMMAQTDRKHWDKLAFDIRGNNFLVRAGDENHKYGVADVSTANIAEVVAAMKPAVAASLDNYHEQAPKQKAVQFLLYRNNATNEIFVAAKPDKEKTPLMYFNSSEEARDFMYNEDEDIRRENLENLNQLWQEHKELNNIVKADMRTAANADRTGASYRDGRDISPEEFMQTFNIRGGQFGNWVKGDERQAHLNQAYDAFMDLSKAANIPPSAIGLDNRLAIAFGARGSGYWSAHYEPRQRVINLTKTRGAGALAHEWWHALDDFMSSTTELATQNFSLWASAQGNNLRERIRTESMNESLKLLIQTINKSDFQHRSSNADGSRSKPYFGTMVEMTARAFESYILNKLSEQGIQNDYLVNTTKFEAWKRNPDAYVYLKDDELETFTQIYDNVFDKLAEADKIFDHEAKMLSEEQSQELQNNLEKINNFEPNNNYLSAIAFAQSAYISTLPPERQLRASKWALDLMYEFHEEDIPFKDFVNGLHNKNLAAQIGVYANTPKEDWRYIDKITVEMDVIEVHITNGEVRRQIFSTNLANATEWVAENSRSFIERAKAAEQASLAEKSVEATSEVAAPAEQAEQVTEAVQTADQVSEFGQSADIDAPSENKTEKELPPQHPVEIPADDKGSKLGSSKSDEYLRKIADRILEQVKNNEAPWQKPFEAGTIHNVLPVSGASGKTYQGLNLINLMATAAAKGYDDNRWYTYNNAQEAGGQVRRGEKGTQIHFWQHPTNEDVEKEKAKAAAEGREPKRLSPMLRIYTVFNADQIDGLPERQLNEALLAKFDRHEKAESILENSGVRIEHTPEKTGYYSAHYNPRTDTITLPQRELFASEDAYYATALHELAHATGHESRLNRDLSGAFGSYSYAKEELRAEMASMMIGQELQIGHDPSNHYAYLQSWAAVIENDPKEFFKAVKDADLITNYVLKLDKTKEKVAEVEQRQSAEQAAEVIAQSTPAKHSLFVVPNDIQEQFDKDVARLNDTMVSYPRPVQTKMPPVLLALDGYNGLSVKDLPLELDRYTLLKMQGKVAGKNDNAHSLTLDDISKLLKEIHDPVAVVKADNGSDLVILTEIETKHGDPIIIPIHLEKEKGKYVFHDMASAYGKEDVARWLNNHAQEQTHPRWQNIVYYNNEKSLTIGTLPHILGDRSHPVGVVPSKALDEIVLKPEDIVKRHFENLDKNSPKMALPADIPHSVHEVAKLDKPLEDKVLMLAEKSAIADKIQSVDNEQLKSFVRGIKTAMDFNEHNYKQLLDLATYYSNNTFDAREFALHTGMVGDQGVAAYDKALQDLADAGILKSVDDGWKYELTDEAAYLIKQTYNVVEAEKVTQQEISSTIAKSEPMSEFGQQQSDFEKELQSINLPEGVNYSYERLNEDVEIARLYVGEWRDDKLIGEQAFIDKNAKYTGYVAKYGENEAQIYNNLQLAVNVVGNQLAKDYAADIAEYKHQQEAIQSAPPAPQAPQGNITAENRRLFVPYEQKDVASALGARWDKANKTWYAPAGSDLDKFKPWLKEPVREFTRPEDEFAKQLEAHGLRLEAGHPIMDGQWHRLKVESDRTGNKSGAYIGHLDGVPRGTVKNFKTGQETNWTAKDAAVKSVPSSLDIERAKAAAEAKQKASYNQAADAAKLVLNHAQPAQNHPYLDKKGVAAHGLYVVPDKAAVNLDNTNLAIANDWREAKAMRENFKANGIEKQVLTKGDLIVPAINEHGDLRTFQTISGNDGSFKSFVKGGEKSGSYHVIGDLNNAKDVMIAEGYATAATLHEQTGKPVVVAFDAGNLSPVAEKVRASLPDARIYIAADNDRNNAVNTGIEKANAAAEKVDAKVIVPQFDKLDGAEKLSDWNDLHKANPHDFVAQLATSDMGRQDFTDKLANLPPERQEVFKGWYDYINEKLANHPEARNTKQASLEQEILKAEQGNSNLPSVTDYQAQQSAKKQAEKVVTQQPTQQAAVDTTAGKGKGGFDR